MKRHLERIKLMPCGLCGASPPSDAHHIRAGQGMAQRASDWLTVPLCRSCHDNLHHGDRAMWKVMKKNELDILADTIARMCG